MEVPRKKLHLPLNLLPGQSTDKNWKTLEMPECCNLSRAVFCPLNSHPLSTFGPDLISFNLKPSLYQSKNWEHHQLACEAYCWDFSTLLQPLTISTNVFEKHLDLWLLCLLLWKIMKSGLIWICGYSYLASEQSHPVWGDSCVFVLIGNVLKN